ncbi:LlaJI family restriction endonuclease [Mesomycoplasma molare]|uniref:LlaJI family restriction endonuclease n=1 Tax=Mesomycoplasma molare TaxID=171288 RepID=A0ABY5TV47_9BACT|nr:LlaJI family restriction endonuclease [Mesomycoplasma molare]UWD34543.1 LlaJI family restriction endonuclease [Mesomycoplasma molare]
MLSKESKIDNKFKIFYHSVTNKINDSFVGLKIKNNKIDFYYPETYNFDDKASIEENRKDILEILNTISIANSLSNPEAKIESSYSNDNILPLPSILWIIKDYLVNGLYINRENVFEKNQKGKIDWKRTINNQPMISNRNVIYKDIVVLNKNKLDNIIVDIHKYCVKKSIDLFGWLFNINNSFFIETKPHTREIKKLYKEILKKELHKTFNDFKKVRLTHLLNIIEGLDGEKNNEEIVYGVDKYSFIFEKMINYIFGNKKANNYNPSANWFFEIENFTKPYKSSELRPDTILEYENYTYIIDSKFYRFGYTNDKSDLPKISSIQKQITYGDYIKNNKLINSDKIRNIFILPYNKQKNSLNLSNNLEYIGFAKSDYRASKHKHEIIHTFLIDLKYLINIWNNKKYHANIKDLIIKISNVENQINKL